MVRDHLQIPLSDGGTSGIVTTPEADSPVYQRIKAKLDKEWNKIVKPGANFEEHNFYLKMSKLGDRAPTSKLEERSARSSSPVYSSSHSSPEQDQTSAHGLNEDLDHGFQYAEDVGAPGLDEEEEEQEQEQENEEKEDEAQPRLPQPKSVLLSSNISADTRPQRLSRSAVQRQSYAPTASQGSEQAPGSSDFGSEDAYTEKASLSDAEDKDESFVQSAAEALLDFLVDAFRELEPHLNIMTGNSPTFYIKGGGIITEPGKQWKMKVEPDKCMHIRADKLGIFTDSFVLMIECKRKCQQGNKESILYKNLGQEVAEMLALAQEFRACRRRSYYYVIYLVSWHHLKCYISRLDVSDAYLKQMETDIIAEFPDHPLVRRFTPKFKLKDHTRSQMFAKTLVELAMYDLALNRHNLALAKRILRGCALDERHRKNKVVRDGESEEEFGQ